MDSEIKPFYSNANIFLTGGTGFFGKVIIQKLLRTCDDISGLYLIVREKKGKSTTERLGELFNDPVFNKLREENPEFLKKVHVVEGDCSRLGFGLNQSSRTLLIDKINIVFHCAATLNMDAKMKDAVDTNVQGLSELLDLCHEMRYLKSMVVVSTAYSNCTQSIIEEKFYDPPVQATTLVKLANELEERVLDEITPGLMSEWPNTYCYTKAVAENMLREKAKDLPAGLFRPSVGRTTHREYKDIIEEEGMKSFNKHCDDALNTDAWSLPYKIIKRKEHVDSILSPVHPIDEKWTDAIG
ncbi:hypothetical protein ILUMI_01406 [Ignelater luminosus]|uniref:Fatty acyl-CoA reductase n=1 Tax=Ignelater luminosus TaxID=2038154 RepID=A0A8K0GHH0_IGNLU|nr:hypothetical protein ILUMI_01406 [Ignelater luminosus]